MKTQNSCLVWVCMCMLLAGLFCLALWSPAHAALTPQETIQVAKKMQVLQMENASLRKELVGVYEALQQMRTLNSQVTHALEVATVTKVSQDALVVTMLDRANSRIDVLQHALENTTRDLQVITKDRNFWRGLCTFGLVGGIGYGVAP